MATEALKELLYRYDIEQNGCLNKNEWIKLCSNDGINLSPELAAALFEGLDTDSDGLVRISDILRELIIYESNSEYPVTPRLQTRRSSSLDPLTSSPSGTAVYYGDRTSGGKDNQVINTKRANRFHHARVLGQLENSRMESFSDPFLAYKETAEDGTEVYSINPAEPSPIRKSLMQLESELSRKYPELLPTLKTVVEDFRSEIITSKKEKSTLEENYLKEKEARKRDLIRLENELESQIQRIEERTKSEIQDRLRGEYDSKIMNKEEEIADIRLQLKRLKARINEREHNSKSIPDSTTGSMMLNNSHDYDAVQNSVDTHETALDHSQLNQIVDKLEQREAELANLKDQLAQQERQILLDKRELLNQEEEKLHLYAQLQSLRFAMAQQEENSSARSGTESITECLTSPLSQEPPKTPKAPERIYKVILVGDTGVGKSSFMHQFCDGIFYPRLRATVGVDFRTRNLRVDNTVYSIQIWDTAGQEKYRSIVRTYFRKVDGVVIMYDVTSPETFGNVRSWMEQIAEHEYDTRAPVVIVGNKTDLRKNSTTLGITREMGEKFAKSHGVMFIETSIPTAENVDEAVRMLAGQMKLNEDKQMATVQLNRKPAKPKLSCCNI